MSDIDASVNPKKLFVGNLSFNTTEPQLQEVLAQFGKIEYLKLITDRMTGRSRGMAFVEYSTEDEAKDAVAKLNGQMLDDRELIVNVARPQAPRENRSFGGGSNNRPQRGGFGGGYGRRDDNRR